MYFPSTYSSDTRFNQNRNYDDGDEKAIPPKMPQDLPFKTHFSERSASLRSASWHQRIIKKLDRCEVKLDKFLPNFQCQIAYDQFHAELMPKAELNNPFNDWLKSNGHGNWYEQLATFLAKLPVKAARNVLRLVLNVIQAAVAIPSYALMHPLKSCVKLAKLLVALAHSLTQPETWSKLGISIVGSALGHATVTSNPISIIAIAFGGALAVAGISLGTLKTALLAEKGMQMEKVQSYLSSQMQKLPEDFLTGYFTVLLLEGIQQVMRGCQKVARWSKHQFNIGSSKDA